MVAWSNVYEPTRDLWQEGNTLVITGKVRVRNDRAQLNCDHVELYSPESFRPVAALPAETVSEATSSPVNTAVAAKAPPAARPASAAREAPSRYQGKPAPAKANHSAARPGSNGHSRSEPVPAPPPEPQAPPRRLVISLAPTADKDGDIARLNQIGELLREFPGRDDVILALENNGKQERYRFATTRYNPELHKRLAEVVGEEGLGVEETVQ